MHRFLKGAGLTEWLSAADLPHMMPDVFAHRGRSKVMVWLDAAGAPEVFVYYYLGRNGPDSGGDTPAGFDRWSRVFAEGAVMTDLLALTTTVVADEPAMTKIFQLMTRVTANDLGGAIPTEYTTNWGVALVRAPPTTRVFPENRPRPPRADGAMSQVRPLGAPWTAPVVAARSDSLGQDIIDALSPAILVVDRDGVVLQHNASAEESLGGPEGLQRTRDGLAFRDRRMVAAVRAATAADAPVASSVQVDREYPSGEHRSDHRSGLRWGDSPELFEQEADLLDAVVGEGEGLVVFTGSVDPDDPVLGFEAEGQLMDQILVDAEAFGDEPSGVDVVDLVALQGHAA